MLLRYEKQVCGLMWTDVSVGGMSSNVSILLQYLRQYSSLNCPQDQAHHDHPAYFYSFLFGDGVILSSFVNHSHSAASSCWIVLSCLHVMCSHHMPSMGPLVWQRGALVISWKGQITHFFYFRTSFDPILCQDFSRINHYLQFYETGF